jgi:MFS family permease
MSMVMFQSIAWWPVLAKDFGIEYAAIGSLIGFYMLPGVVLAFPGGMIGKRFGDKRVVLLGLAIMTIASVLIGFSKSYSVAAIGRVLGGMGAILMNVLMTKMVADWFAKGNHLLVIFVNSWPAGIGLPRNPAGMADIAGWPWYFCGAAPGVGFACHSISPPAVSTGAGPAERSTSGRS